MTLISNSFASSASWIAGALVGLVLVWSGGIKAIAPHTFRRHLQFLGWIPSNLLASAVTLIAAFEVGWGTALFLNIARPVILPVSAFLLVCFALVSWWSVTSGRTTDCGCYGGYIQPSLWQSIAMNGAFVALLVLARVLQPSIGTDTSRIMVAAPVVLAGIAGGIAYWAQRFEKSHGAPKFVTSPLKRGARWKDAWANGATRSLQGEFLVTLMGPDCPFCKQWVKVGNAIIQSPVLPRVVGVIPGQPEAGQKFADTYHIRFPVATISQSLMSRLTQAVPTSILVVDGVIDAVWEGRMAPEFVDRFRSAFFPDSMLEAVGTRPIDGTAAPEARAV